MMLKRLAVPAALVLLLAGCSWFGSSKPDYKGARARAAQPLEVPPELSAPTMDDRYQIPDPRSQTTYSAYSREQGAGGTAPQKEVVLPAVQGVRMERSGSQRWLVVKGDADKVWPLVRQFWIDSDFTLARESPEVGIMETEWHEDRARIPQDFVRRTIGRVLDFAYSTPRRDKFRTRLEKGAEPGTTEIFVSDRAMEEVYTNENQDRTVWQPLAPDSELEAEMLSKLMVKLGGKEPTTTAQATVPAGTRPAAVGGPSAAEAPRNAVLENSGAGPLVVNDGFDRAWRRVGLALDRVGFTVEDRDRSKGLFFVRYIDPEADAAAGEKKGFLASLAFWRSTPKSAQPQYRIQVSDAGASMSQVRVLNAKGEPETSSTGRRILSLLFEQLK